MAAAPERSRGPVSLKDVAAQAGVSIKTVSNVVNGYEHVSAATRARVQSALTDLNYVPNLSARNLRSRRSGLMALALPNIDGPYYAELARLIVDVAAEHDCTVLIDQTGGVRERELEFVSGIRPQLIDALIFTPLALTRDDLVGRRHDQPLVLLGEAVDDGSIEQVSIDSRAAGRAATEHLLSLGRRRIAAVGAPSGELRSMAHVHRHQGYRDALTSAGVATDRDLVVATPGLQAPDGFAAMQRLLSLPRPPEAVFCFNDVLALGAIRALHTAGRRVPDDVAVIGFDDIEMGAFITPTLSTIAPDKAQIARSAVAAALRQLDPTRAAVGAAPLKVGFELVVRESTAGP